MGQKNQGKNAISLYRVRGLSTANSGTQYIGHDLVTSLTLSRIIQKHKSSDYDNTLQHTMLHGYRTVNHIAMIKTLQHINDQWRSQGGGGGILS